MDTQTFIASLIIFIIVLAWPLVSVLAQGALKRFEHTLPQASQDMLERYAKFAVQSVEQASATKTGAEKRQAALEIIKDLFIAAKLPLPNMSILGYAIEMAVYMLKQEQMIAQPTATK